MNEAQIEALLDRRVQARIRTDRDYLFAENAEQQALAERKIELQEEYALLAAGGRDLERMAEIDMELEQLYAELRGE